MNSLFFLFLLFLASLAGTEALRRYACKTSLMDIPNFRSSHQVPTPRGGGLAVVISAIAGFSVLSVWGGVTASFMTAMVLGCGGVAVIGFMDDRGHIEPSRRLVGHFIAAFWIVGWLGGLPHISVFGFEFQLGFVGYFLAVLYLVWMLNLYNFMDGIDGIAGVEAVTVCLAAAGSYWLAGVPQLMPPVLIVAASAAGFLVWNFPPAKIFMGDSGSGFLGVVLGMLSLVAAWAQPVLLYVWLILLGVFIVDATLTLAIRSWHRERVHEAHRSHAYQFAARRFNNHLPVTTGVALINLLWLAPIAGCVALGKLDGLLGLAISYCPLVWIAFKFKAGQRESAVAAVTE